MRSRLLALGLCLSLFLPSCAEPRRPNEPEPDAPPPEAEVRRPVPPRPPPVPESPVRRERERERKEPQVRVSLPGPAFAVLIRGTWTAVDEGSGKLLDRGQGLEGAFSLDAGAVRVGARRFASDRVRIRTTEQIFSMNRVPYAGDLFLGAASDGRPLALNLLGLERYLAGVLGAECPLDWPEESLKALAVAARTYALAKMGERAGGDFDLVAGVMDQCYGGLDQENALSRRLVRETAGEVLTWHRLPFPAFYSACCGGQTADGPNALMEAPAIAPLRGHPCPYCRLGLPFDKQERFRWKKKLPRAHLDKVLGAPRPLISIRPSSPDLGGHAGHVRLSWAGGGKDLDMLSFRRAAGISSNSWTAQVKGKDVHFVGRGFGHGVGLCQWGVRRMGQEGFSHREILEFYYPGAALLSWY